MKEYLIPELLRAEIISHQNEPFITCLIKDQKGLVRAHGEWYLGDYGIEVIINNENNELFTDIITPYPPSLMEGHVTFLILEFMEDYIDIDKNDTMMFFIESGTIIYPSPTIHFSAKWKDEKRYFRLISNLEKQSLMPSTSKGTLNSMPTLSKERLLNKPPSLSLFIHLDRIHNQAYITVLKDLQFIGGQKWVLRKNGDLIYSKYNGKYFESSRVVKRVKVKDFHEFSLRVVSILKQYFPTANFNISTTPPEYSEVAAFLELFYA